jgi:hypothetical protein
LKLVDSELSKDLFGTLTNSNNNSINLNGGGGATTWSLCSPQQITGLIQNQPHHQIATPILQNLTLLNTSQQPIEFGRSLDTSSTTTSASIANNPANCNYIITSQVLNTTNVANNLNQHISLNQMKQSDNNNNNNNTSLLMDHSQLSTLKLIGHVDQLMPKIDHQQLLQQQHHHQTSHIMQPQFTELKAVGLVNINNNNDSFSS